MIVIQCRGIWLLGVPAMLPIDLDVTRAVRAYMASCMEGNVSLDRMQSGLRDAAWYSAKDRRALRALCDAHPDFTRWLFARESDGRYTGLIMVWPGSYATPIHDHAGLWGIEMVLQGTLAVDDYAFESDGGTNPELRFVGTTLLQEGESCAFLGTAGHAHRCMNPLSRRAAVTLHVYGGLLETYRTFEEAGDNGHVARQTAARIDGSVGPLRVRSA